MQLNHALAYFLYKRNYVRLINLRSGGAEHGSGARADHSALGCGVQRRESQTGPCMSVLAEVVHFDKP